MTDDTTIRIVALRHVAWLASEQRHTTLDDGNFRFAAEKGWCSSAPGVMQNDRWFRVAMTQAGMTALTIPVPPSAGDLEYLSWGAQ